MKRIKRVQEHSKMAISLMVCGNAAGDLLPPFVIYKALNCYENWTKNGPVSAQYDATKSGWFDSRTFQSWFFNVFLPHVSEITGQKILVGDNLGSHFSPEVVEAAIANDIYSTSPPYPLTQHT